MTPSRVRGPVSVDETFSNRHESATHGGVESAVRAAGGVPTLGGGSGEWAGTIWTGVGGSARQKSACPVRAGGAWGVGR
jgi:hypothetical protein